jgi:hypothetical protein
MPDFVEVSEREREREREREELFTSYLKCV